MHRYKATVVDRLENPAKVSVTRFGNIDLPWAPEMGPSVLAALLPPQMTE